MHDTYTKLTVACFLILAGLPLTNLHAEEKETTATLRFSLQERMVVDGRNKAVSNRIEDWNPNETAIIICDMWDKHWCDGATERVSEIAPVMNNVLTIARNQGVKIVHAPSDCMNYYSNHLARKEAARYLNNSFGANSNNLPSENGIAWPIDQSDEGCECDGCGTYHAWTKQIDALTIKNEDLISDNGNEIGPYFIAKGIKNVILMGVHTNMCIVNRSFGMRAMKRAGFNVVLMRDMTDLMYNDRSSPFVNRFSGLDLIIEYIETCIAPSIVSTDFTGEKQFRFKDDKRKKIAFLIAEKTNQFNRFFHDFSHELILKNIHSDFIIGDAGEGYGGLENIQAIETADLAVFAIENRLLEPEKMLVIKNYIAEERSVLAFSSTLHSAFTFDGNTPMNVVQWPEFGQQVLGGNYRGVAETETPTSVVVVPELKNHPLLKNVGNFSSSAELYKNNPLKATVTVLLKGNNETATDEPVFWLNNCNIIYTSLGHPNDWKESDFKNLLFNSVDYLLHNINSTK
jgi:nicotinamidase-related amidase